MSFRRYDVVVGAGIVGFAHAYHAHRQGLSVAVVDHVDQVAGASVRNFGHASTTTLFYGFAGAAALAAIIPVLHWNRVPATERSPSACGSACAAWPSPSPSTT